MHKYPTEKCKTCDSKTEVVKHLRRMLEATVPNIDYDEGFVDGVEFGVSTVSTMPTVKPEPCGDKSYALWKESYEELKRRMDELTSCSDTISRQATIDAVNNAFDRETLLTGFVRSIAVRAIRDMPTIQPEPKEGHWIEVAGELECSECHTVFTDLYPDYADSVACPNCGAKMTEDG